MTGSRLLSLAGAAALLAFVAAGCGTGAPASTAPARPVMSKYRGWSISVTPALIRDTNRWRARVEVWPPERRPDTYPGVLVHFSETATDRTAVEQAATAAARRHIDASEPVHLNQ